MTNTDVEWLYRVRDIARDFIGSGGNPSVLHNPVVNHIFGTGEIGTWNNYWHLADLTIGRLNSEQRVAHALGLDQ